MAAAARWHLRTQKRAVGKEVTFEGFSSDTVSQSGTFGSAPAIGPAASGPTPSRYLMQAELRERISAAIAELP